MSIILKKPRNSNLELLRIIAMMFIIAHHFSVHGFSNFDSFAINLNSVFIFSLAVLGKIGVDVFILISAYFMINSKFTFRKFLLLEGEVYFYSVIIFLLFITVLTPQMDINFNVLLQTFLPVSHNAYWFMTDYITLMMLSPFLNRFIKALSRDDFIKILILLLIIWSFIPTFSGVSFGYDYMIWFVVLYFIGSFLKLHVDLSKIKSKHLNFSVLILFALLFIIYSASKLLFLSNDVEIFKLFAQWIMAENSLLILLTSITLFLVFLKRKGFSNKYINYLSGSVLGVYLIHDNNFVRPFLWKKILDVTSFYPSKYLILISVILILAIYVICIFIDIIRRITVEKLWIYLIDYKLNSIPSFIKKQFISIKRKVEHYCK